MPRHETTIEELRNRYNKLYLYLKEKKESVMIPEICKDLDMKKCQISKALQYGRRCFSTGEINVWNTIMAGPKGLFIPKDDDEIKAWILQGSLDARSRATTMLPYMSYLIENDPDAYSDFLDKCCSSIGDDEMHPFEVFNKLTNLFYVERDY